MAGKPCPETAVIVMSVPNCRRSLSASVGPQFRTRIDNVRGEQPVQRYRPLHRRIRTVPETRFCTSGTSRQPNPRPETCPDLPAWKSALAKNHGFAAENSCCPVRNPAARGWENKCSMCGSGVRFRGCARRAAVLSVVCRYRTPCPRPHVKAVAASPGGPIRPRRPEPRPATLPGAGRDAAATAGPG